MSPGEFVLRLGVAVLAGALIGLERQWRSRGAGLRTNTLVAGGAAMFVLISSLTPDDNSPTRIASYVVSGVGFLGAGVIISDGVSVRGINTAATLWCAAAAGALAGSGFVWEAGIATAAVLAINLALRPLGRLIDRASIDGDSEVETTYRFRATTKGSGEAHVRALLLQSISGDGYHLRALESADIDGTGLVEVRAVLTTSGRHDNQIEAAAGRLGLEPNVTAVRWEAVEPEAAAFDPAPVG
ncbi:MAG: MgtC/SapB family protein [Actinobacteria bacterium]|nr:MgtC/SapB family protein [Actinomycetota bacterium]